MAWSICPLNPIKIYTVQNYLATKQKQKSMVSFRKVVFNSMNVLILTVRFIR